MSEFHKERSTHSSSDRSNSRRGQKKKSKKEDRGGGSQGDSCRDEGGGPKRGSRRDEGGGPKRGSRRDEGGGSRGDSRRDEGGGPKRGGRRDEGGGSQGGSRRGEGGGPQGDSRRGERVRDATRRRRSPSPAPKRTRSPSPAPKRTRAPSPERRVPEIPMRVVNSEVNLLYAVEAISHAQRCMPHVSVRTQEANAKCEMPTQKYSVRATYSDCEGFRKLVNSYARSKMSASQKTEKRTYKPKGGTKAEVKKLAPWSKMGKSSTGTTAEIIEFSVPVGKVREALKSQLISWERDRVHVPMMGRVSFRVKKEEYGTIKFTLMGTESDCYAFKTGFDRVYGAMSSYRLV